MREKEIYRDKMIKQAEILKNRDQQMKALRQQDQLNYKQFLMD